MENDVDAGGSERIVVEVGDEVSDIDLVTRDKDGSWRRVGQLDAKSGKYELRPLDTDENQ